MGKEHEEHKGFASPRDALSFLLNDETEAVNGYDLVLRSVPLEEADRIKLERIRNAEIDHIKDLSDIYQKYSTAKFVGTDSRSVKDSKWVMHQHSDGYFYFKDSAGSVYSENGVEKHFTDKEPAGEFYIRNLYNADAWDGGVPRVVVDAKVEDSGSLEQRLSVDISRLPIGRLNYHTNLDGSVAVSGNDEDLDFVLEKLGGKYKMTRGRYGLMVTDSVVRDYSARGSFNSIGELKSHYAGATLLPEGDRITVVLKSGAELVYSYVGNGKLAFIRGKN